MLMPESGAIGRNEGPRKGCPSFSVITVVLNDFAGLRRTWESIQSQTLRDYEWIVVDGGSRDGIVEFLAQLPQGSARWLSEKDRGMYDAMNKGVRLACGEWVVFMNAGDLLSAPQVLQQVQQSIVTSGKPIDVLFGGATLVTAAGARRYRRPYPIEDYVWHGLPAIHQATFYRRQRILATPYDLQYRLCGDYYIIAMLYRQGLQAQYLDSSLAEFRVGGSSYQRRRELCEEPYRIQRDVLGLSCPSRCRSLAKRLISTLGLIAFNQPWWQRWSRHKSQASASGQWNAV